jgi:hypothetical protein
MNGSTVLRLHALPSITHRTSHDATWTTCTLISCVTPSQQSDLADWLRREGITAVPVFLQRQQAGGSSCDAVTPSTAQHVQAALAAVSESAERGAAGSSGAL